MFKYICKRILLIPITLLGITLLCFLINAIAPGGPIEQKLSQLRLGGDVNIEATSSQNEYGVSEEIIQALKAQYGFDKPITVQYLLWLKNILTFNFGESFITEEPVIEMIAQRLPVSMQFGIISLILVYLLCIIVGVGSAVKKDQTFDVVSAIVLIILYSIPPLILGILLKVFLAGGAYLDWFPIGDLYSDNYFEKNFWGRVWDRVHHFILPLICYIIGSFAVFTQYMRNNMLEEISQDYIRTARAKGLSESAVVYKHALKNALLPMATGLSGLFAFFLSGALIIEKIFSINGIGLLAYQSVLQRDYNVIMALIFIQSALFLIGRLFSDIIYVVLDPRVTYQ